MTMSTAAPTAAQFCFGFTAEGWLVGAYCARSSSGRVSIVPSWKPSDGELTSGDSSVASGVSSVEGALTSTGRRSSGLARRASSSSGLEKRSQRSAPSACSSAALPTGADAPDAASAAWGRGDTEANALAFDYVKSASYFSAAPIFRLRAEVLKTIRPVEVTGGCVRRPTPDLASGSPRSTSEGTSRAPPPRVHLQPVRQRDAGLEGLLLLVEVPRSTKFTGSSIRHDNGYRSRLTIQPWTV